MASFFRGRISHVPSIGAGTGRRKADRGARLDQPVRPYPDESTMTTVRGPRSGEGLDLDLVELSLGDGAGVEQLLG